jgi:uncharacterized protein YqiB (DUF1249 family)
MARKRYRIDLPAHMAECDANYLRLMKLFPRLREDDVSVFAMVLGQHPYQVRFEVLERGPYTTLIELRHLPEAPWNLQPRMRVRLYHDARSAEVVDYLGARHFRPSYAYPNNRMHLPDEKAQVNRFLSEFLAMCLANGMSITELAPTS